MNFRQARQRALVLSMSIGMTPSAIQRMRLGKTRDRFVLVGDAAHL